MVAQQFTGQGRIRYSWNGWRNGCEGIHKGIHIMGILRNIHKGYIMSTDKGCIIKSYKGVYVVCMGVRVNSWDQTIQEPLFMNIV